MTPRLLPLLSLFLGFLACRSPAAEHASTPVAKAPAAQAPKVATAPAHPGCTLVLIRTGPQSGKLDKQANDAAFAGHFANMGRLANERKLLVAGPYGERRHDSNLRGIFVLASERRAEAEAWAGTDPTTRAGVFVLEFHDLATDAPLAEALERDLAWRARMESEGKTPAPGEGARPYVLLTAEDGTRAEHELADLRTSDGGVLLLGRLDGTRAFAILDAQDLDEARERFGPWLEHLGPHVLDEWFASNQLAQLVH